MQSGDGDGVAPQFQVLETLAVRACGRPLKVDPHVLVADFVRQLRPELLDFQQRERRFRNENERSLVEPDPDLPNIDHLYVPRRVAPNCSKPGSQSGQLAQRSGVEVRDLTLRGHSREASCLVIC